MEFFCYHRDRSDTDAMRGELLEAHWSYMDQYAREMIARGPTLTADRELATGSIHVLDLPDVATARAFVFDEPNYRAGVYRDVMLRRWRNMLGRSMWDFPGGRNGDDRYLVLGLGAGRASEPELPAGWDGDALIAFGPLLSDDGASWLGTVALVRAADAEAARRVLSPDADRYSDIEVHAWQFGGRPS